MIKNHLWIWGLVGLLFLSSCESEKDEFLPGYSGGFGELVVVMDKQAWDSPTGDSVFAILGGEQYGFPQPEAYFNVIQVAPPNFKSVLRTHRNIVVMDVSANNAGKETLELDRSKWAKGQYVLQINATGSDHLLEILTDEQENIRSIFQTAEINRHIERNKKFGDASIGKELAGIQGYSMLTQKDAFLDKNRSGLAWIRSERERNAGGFQHQVSQGIMIFSRPYLDKEDFADSNIIAFANQTFEQHLPGPDTGQYMQLDERYLPPLGQEINFKDQFAKEFRGLWRMEGNFMGGPFYLLAYLDEPRGRIIYAYGYVFAPQFKKREYLREVEAMIHSIEATDASAK